MNPYDIPYLQARYNAAWARWEALDNARKYIAGQCWMAKVALGVAEDELVDAAQTRLFDE
jgi:hypothetical protein